MRTHQDLAALAADCHNALPPRIRQYLNARGIPDAAIDKYMLGWNGARITIPVFNREGQLAFFKLARDPEDNFPTSPKMVTWPRAHVELYGWEHLLAKPDQIIICEGEFDRLVLEANAFPAVTSTGGAGTFRPEWAEQFIAIPEVFICFDRDDAGRNGALRVGRLIPHARIVELPDEVRIGGDVTDFFARLGHSREEFQTLLDQAKPAPPAPPKPARPYAAIKSDSASPERQRIEAIKSNCPITEIIGQYVELQVSGDCLKGHCPFHADQRPSLAVYPATNTFFCFGCRKHGDVITFVREIEHLSFNQALNALEKFTHHTREPEIQQDR